jgi:hypothetical protein
VKAYLHPSQVDLCAAPPHTAFGDAQALHPHAGTRTTKGRPPGCLCALAIRLP